MKNNSFLSKEDIDLLKKINLDYDYENKLTEQQIIDIEDKVSDYLALHCLDDDYKPNEEGKICYNILDNIDNFSTWN